MISRHRPIYRVLAVYTLHNLLGVLMELNRITSVEPLYKKVFTYMRLSTHMHAGIYVGHTQIHAYFRATYAHTNDYIQKCYYYTARMVCMRRRCGIFYKKVYIMIELWLRKTLSICKE